MEILFVLIPLSVLLIAFALWSFVWSVKNDQFEDLDRQGWTILFDDKDRAVKDGAGKDTENTENTENTEGTEGTEDTEDTENTEGKQS